ncbi:AzlD domain-containing protein [Kaistia dalseonensis]|uniref:Membrane protein n=1 Tax=Kaistia dalseonensis TaxID=410840 RepID=A0ABU0HDI9_9HYPH|nr:AzlD domain-containing protein [Kaistia dalseonensis]MCX5497166.1 AzlD domain-containing protein [Kaistia dalseonensis]MDQ0439795.1 putative membrane protein [Kaistia dalseonensis]
MSIDPNTTAGFAIIVFAMALAAYATRISGFFLMRFVAVTPRVEAWLKALPLAIMGAILAPIAMHGGPAEYAGFAATIAVFLWRRNDIIAALAGMAAVAAMRALFGL